MIEVEGFNSDFREYANRNAGELLLLLKQSPDKENPKLLNATAPDGTPMNDTIPGTSVRAAVDYQGQEHSRYFEHEDKYIGLADDDYKQSVKLIKAILKNKAIDGVITANEVRRGLFGWLQACYNGKERDTQHFFDHLIGRLNSLVTNHKVQIAISYVDVQIPLDVGNVTFGKLTEEEFRNYEQILRSKSEENLEQRVASLHAMKVRYRVFTFATTFVLAEQSKAIEIARDRVERALTVLRFFSMTAFDPSLPSYFTVSGENDVKISSILVTSEGRLPSVISSMEEDRRHEWLIGIDQIKFFNSTPTFQAVAKVMMGEVKTEMASLLQQCIQLFGQSIRTQDYHLKLVFLMVAMESLFSKNSSEPIAFSIGQRLAFFLYLNEGNLQERKDTYALLRSMYDLRSGYLHHGKENVESHHIAEFQNAVWQCLERAAINVENWKKKEDFLFMLDNRIMS